MSSSREQVCPSATPGYRRFTKRSKARSDRRELRQNTRQLLGRAALLPEPIADPCKRYLGYAD